MLRDFWSQMRLENSPSHLRKYMRKTQKWLQWSNTGVNTQINTNELKSNNEAQVSALKISLSLYLPVRETNRNNNLKLSLREFFTSTYSLINLHVVSWPCHCILSFLFYVCIYLFFSKLTSTYIYIYVVFLMLTNEADKNFRQSNRKWWRAVSKKPKGLSSSSRKFTLSGFEIHKGWQNHVFLEISRFSLLKRCEKSTPKHTRELSQLTAVSPTQGYAFDSVVRIVVSERYRPTAGSHDR